METLIQTQAQRQKETRFLVPRVAQASVSGPGQPSLQINNFYRTEKLRKAKQAQALRKVRALYYIDKQKPSSSPRKPTLGGILVANRSRFTDEWSFYQHVYHLNMYFELLSKRGTCQNNNLSPTSITMPSPLGPLTRKGGANGYYGLTAFESNCRYTIYLLISNYLQNLKEAGPKTDSKLQKHDLEKIRQLCLTLKSPATTSNPQTPILPDILEVLVQIQQRIYQNLLNQWRASQSSILQQLNSTLLIGQKLKVQRTTITAQNLETIQKRARRRPKLQCPVLRVKTLGSDCSSPSPRHNKSLFPLLQGQAFENYRPRHNHTESDETGTSSNNNNNRRNQLTSFGSFPNSLDWGHSITHKSFKNIIRKYRTNNSYPDAMDTKQQPAKGSPDSKQVNPLSIIQDLDLNSYLREAQLVRKSQSYTLKIVEGLRKRNSKLFSNNEYARNFSKAIKQNDVHT